MVNALEILENYVDYSGGMDDYIATVSKIKRTDIPSECHYKFIESLIEAINNLGKRALEWLIIHFNLVKDDFLPIDHYFNENNIYYEAHDEPHDEPHNEARDEAHDEPHDEAHDELLLKTLIERFDINSNELFGTCADDVMACQKIFDNILRNTSLSDIKWFFSFAGLNEKHVYDACDFDIVVELISRDINIIKWMASFYPDGCIPGLEIDPLIDAVFISEEEQNLRDGLIWILSNYKCDRLADIEHSNGSFLNFADDDVEFVKSIVGHFTITSDYIHSHLDEIWNIYERGNYDVLQWLIGEYNLTITDISRTDISLKEIEFFDRFITGLGPKSAAKTC